MKAIYYVGLGCAAGAAVGLGIAISRRSDGGGPVPSPGPLTEPVPGCPPPGARVLLIGDSYAQGLTAELKSIAKACVTPFGSDAVVGSHVTEWASDSWLRPALGLLTPPPNVALVSLGANDFQRNDPANVKAGVTTLVGKLRAAGCRVLWIAPLTEPFPDDVGALAMWREAVGSDWFDSTKVDIPRTGDGIHSTPAGYAAWAEQIWMWASEVLTPPPLGLGWSVWNPPVPTEWLIRRLSSIRAAEAEMRKDRVGHHISGPQWRHLKRSWRPGDEIWYFDSPPETWQVLAGRRGYALVRDGVAFESSTTMLN